METIVMCVAILVASFFTFILLQRKNRIEESTFNTIMAILLNWIVCVGIAAIVLHSTTKYEIKTCVTYELISLHNMQAIQGNFFLGSGYINQEMVYAFYYKEGSGYRFKQIPAAKSKIFYTKDLSKINYFQTIEIPYLKIGNDYTIENDWYNIYVPEGTIKQDFELNQ